MIPIRVRKIQQKMCKDAHTSRMIARSDGISRESPRIDSGGILEKGGLEDSSSNGGSSEPLNGLRVEENTKSCGGNDSRLAVYGEMCSIHEVRTKAREGER